MSEPTTEAGRRLRQFLLYPNRSYSPHEIAIRADAAILAIEQGARADLAARIIAAVEGLPQQTVHADPFFPETFDYQTVGLDAVLRAIREASDDRRA